MSNLKDTFTSSIPMIEGPGRLHILKTLNACNDPWQTINHLQSTLSLPAVLNTTGSNATDHHDTYGAPDHPHHELLPIFDLLDLLKCSRLNIALNLFEDLKHRVDAFVQSFDEQKLLVFLKDTIQLINVKELKGIPISIIKRLKVIPPVYLDTLAKKNFLSEFPLSIKRLAWEREVNVGYFFNEIDTICECKESTETFKFTIITSKVTVLSDLIGQSDGLMKAFANHCCELALRPTPSSEWGVGAENDPYKWGGVLLKVLMSIHNSGQQAKSDSRIVFNFKFLEFLLVLSTCSRNGHIDDGSIKTIVDILKALIVAQYNTLEKQYQQQVDNYNQQVGAAKRETQHKGSRPVASAKTKPVAQRNTESKSNSSSKSAAKSTAAPVPTKDAAAIKDIDIPPTRTISKEKLRSFLEKAWKFLESEDSKKLFLHQVTEDIAPGYSKRIKKPMFLLLIQSKISKFMYNTAEEFDADVQTIFRNCRQWNGPDSSFGKYASAVGQKWNKKFRELQSVVKAQEDLLNNSQPRPPQSLVQPPISSSSSSSSSNSSTSGNIVKVNNEHSSNTLAGDSSASSNKRKASEPVESLDAQEKMKKMKKEDELADIGLLNAGAAGVYRKLSITASLDLASPETLYDVLGMALTYLSSCDKEKYFAKPVTDRDAPGYSQIIPNKMALSMMKSKIAAREYSGGLDEFSADVELIVRNCCTYNFAESIFFKAAERFMKNWKLLLELIRKKAESKPTRSVKKETLGDEPPVIATTSSTHQAPSAKSTKATVTATAATAAAVSTTMASPTLKGDGSTNVQSSTKSAPASSTSPTRTAAIDRHQHSGEIILLSKVMTYPEILKVVDSSALEIADQLPWTEEQLQRLDSIAAKVRENIASDQIMKKAIFTAMWDYLTLLDVDGLFGQPVNSEEYHRVITKPMDLSLIKVKIDNRKKYKLQELDADFKVMFNNCFLFNESYSGVYQAAEKLQYAWSLAERNLTAILTGDQSHLRLPSSLPTTSEESENEPIKAETQELEPKNEHGLEPQPEQGEVSEPILAQQNEQEPMQAEPDEPIHAQDTVPELVQEQQQEQAPTPDEQVQQEKQDSEQQEPEPMDVVASVEEEKSDSLKAVADKVIEPEVSAHAEVSGTIAPTPPDDSNSQKKTESATERLSSVATTSNSPSPSKPLVAPVRSPLLESSMAASAWLSQRPEQKSTDGQDHPGDLPAVLLDDKLKWAIAILRDPAITQLLRKYLGEKLRHLLTAIQNPTLAGPSRQSSGSPPLPLLPFEDRQCRHVLQLCQLAFIDDITTIHPVSNKILRELVPQIMAEIISNDGYRSDEAAIVEDKGSIDYRSVAAKMKAQDDKSMSRVVLRSIESASADGSKEMDSANASRFRQFFESLGKQLADKRIVKKN